MSQKRSSLTLVAVWVFLLAGGLAIQAAVEVTNGDVGSIIQTESYVSAKDGGEIPISYKGQVYAVFSVGPHSMKDDAIITVDALVEKTKGSFSGFAVNFGPDGQTFAPSATFSLERPLLELYAGANLAIWDEKGKLLWSGDIDESIERVSMKIKHFSLYYFERR